MPPQLALRFLGSPQLYRNDVLVTTSRRKAVALLAFLAVERGSQTRDSLSALFWPDYDQSKAFTNLRHTLWEVQQTIGEGWIIADRGTIVLSPDADITLDVQQFESWLAKSRALQQASSRALLLCEAVDLYRNHFLTGFSLKDSPSFNEWAFTKSEELRHQLSLALVILSEDYCALGQAEQAISYARRLITLDPLNEASHRQLMQVYLQSGQHSAALKQYQACEQILRRELGVDPAPETRDLYKKIRKREPKPARVEIQTAKGIPSHNLPLQLSSFIGREKEQKVISKLISNHRLVTLIGAGGIGKTRLSLKVGEELLSQFADGIWFVELASLNDPTLLPQAVGTVFGLVERAKNTFTEKLVQYLQSKTTLLILDNCEHLIDASARLVEALLTSCPNLNILATSREALGLAGEVLYQVPSLSLPKASQVDQLEGFEATRLFVERARLSAGDVSFSPEELPLVAEICHRLDGIPLAIELAAARVNTLSVQQIAARLKESFRLLASNGRTRLARQQTLQASIEWSWNLLSAPERVLLRRLSVFAGGWTLDAAESVGGSDGIESGQVLDLLTQLVMKSLIVVDHETAGEKRYRLLEMIRQYAQEKLANSGEEETLRDLHLRYFLDICTQAELGLRGPSHVDWMERLHQERNNVRGALRWAEKTDVEVGLFLASRLLRYWESSDMRGGTHWLESFLQRAESRQLPLARASALLSYGILQAWLHNFDQARLAAEECLRLFRQAGHRAGEVDGLVLLANMFMYKSELETAESYGQQAIQLSQALGDPWREANALYYQGWITRDYDLLFARWGKAISLFRDVGDQVALATALGWLGQFRVLNGDVELAERYLEEARQLWQSNKMSNTWDNARLAKSLILLLRGEYEQANSLLREILVYAEETGNTMSKLWVTVRLGYVALRSGNLAEARQYFKDCAHQFARDGYMIGTVFAVEGMAGLYAAVGKHAHTARLVGWADAMRVPLKDRRPNIEQADVDKLIAACLAKMGELAFSDAYEEGQKMTLEDALVFAFAES